MGKIFTTVKYVFFGAKVSHLLKSKNSNSKFKKQGGKGFPMGQITDYSNHFIKKSQHTDMGTLQDWRLDRYKDL